MDLLSKNRNAVVLGMVLLFLVLLLAYLLSVNPKAKLVDERKADLDRVTSQNELIRNKIAQIKAEQSNEAMDPSEVSALLPNTDKSEQMLLDLSRISQDTLVDLESAAFTSLESNRIAAMTGNPELLFPGVRELAVSAVVSGTYKEIRSWLDELQGVERMIVVDGFSFQQPYEFGEPGSLLKANVTFTAYYLP